MSAGVVLCLVHSHLCFVLVGRYVEYMVTMLSWKLQKRQSRYFYTCCLGQSNVFHGEYLTAFVCDPSCSSYELQLMIWMSFAANESHTVAEYSRIGRTVVPYTISLVSDIDVLFVCFCLCTMSGSRWLAIMFIH